MVTIPLITSDSKIWNLDNLLIDLSWAMSTDQTITIDLVKEGPDLECLGLTLLLEKLSSKFNYDLNKVSIVTYNYTQPELINVVINKQINWRFIENTQKQLIGKAENKDIQYHFGMFVGRSNLYRLLLASHLWKYHRDKTIQSFHYNWSSDFHKDNLGIDYLIQQHGPDSAEHCVEFLKHCPMLLNDRPTYPILLDQHCNVDQYYHSFFVEIICETYYSGVTFFPTEKLWRAIALKTPFIVQGPQYFLNNLHKLGFKTFSQWWDEGYNEDPSGWQPQEIIKVLDYLSSKSLEDLKTMHAEMQSVLEHNHRLFYQFTPEDFKCLS